MSHIAYSLRRSPSVDPIRAERRRCAAWLRTSLAAVLLALPILPVMAADAPGVTTTTLHSFSGTDGANAFAALVQGTDGKLYGTTQSGGAYSGTNNYYDGGTIYSVNADGTGFQVLHSFNGTDGAYPYGRLVLLNGVFYGTTYEGGANGGNNGNYYGDGGTIFKINPDGTGFQTLHNFSGTDGNEPVSGLTVANGILYGTTEWSSTGNSQGTVFKISPDGTGFQTLHSFSGTEGYEPYGNLALLNGVLYGTTYEGGANSGNNGNYYGGGTVFKISLDGTGFQSLHSFNGTDGSEPFAGLTAAGGVLYGTSSNGGVNGQGTVFTLNPDGTGFQTLHSFNGTDGGEPWSGLTLATDGALYGTTQSGGDDGGGTIFSVSPDGTGFENLHSFGSTEGQSPWATVIQATDGNFYGTAPFGGPGGSGTVYRMTIGPATTATLAGTQGAHGWFTGAVTVTLTATDISAPITHTFYAVDGGTPQTYTAPFVISGDLAHTITFHSEDAHGNIESDENQAVDIDGTLPTLTFSAPDLTANGNGWYNAAVHIPFAAADATSGVDTPGTSGAVPFTTEGASQTQTVTVTDVAGNHKDFITAPALNIDLTKPITTGTASGTQSLNNDYTGPATVTLTASDNLSGVVSTVYSIDGSAPQPYTQPFTVSGDGSHAITFHSVDNADNSENTKTLNLITDTTAPTTTANLAGTQGAHGWYTGDVTVTLLAADAQSGVANTYYTLDDGAQMPYTAPFVVSGDAVHTIKFHSVDTDGNTESEKTQAVDIDGTMPTLTFGTADPAPNADGWNNTDVSLPFTTGDATSGVDTTAPSGPVAVISGEGTSLAQTVTVTDVAGNSVPFTTPAVNIDRTKPVTLAATQSGPTGQQVTLTASDSLSGVASTFYSMDDGDPLPYTQPFTVSGNGDHTIKFHSVDKAGNVEDEGQVQFTVNIDAPTTTATLVGTPGDNGWYTGDVTVTLAAHAGAVPVAATFYTVDGGTPQTYTTPFVVSGDLAHSVAFWSVDSAGNAEAHNQKAVKIDGTPPAATAAVSGPQGANNTYTGPVQVALTASDNLSGIASLSYAVDGGDPQSYTQPFTVSGDSSHTVTFQTVDKAGNAQSVATLSVVIAKPVLHTFQPGLQMLAVPETYDATGPDFSLPVGKVAFWSPQMIQYTLQGADAPLQPGQGYWVRLAQSTDLYDTGAKTPTNGPFSISLQKGWNMIGDPFPSSVSVSDIKVRNTAGKSFSIKDANLANLLSLALYSYPAGASAYQVTGGNGSLSPYLGYWVYAFQPCTVDISAP